MSVQLAFQVKRKSFSLNVQLGLPSQGVTALFGRSGSGKTTLLRCIAGLERHSGYLAFRNCLWQDDQKNLFVPTYKRALGYVFQEASLFPHLRVSGNLNYGFKRVPLQSRHIQPDEVIQLLNLEPLLAHYPSQLSGGQRQRVSLGRAILTSPELLLMDEPLASLDAASKEEILPFLERLRDELNIPILYVSHSIDEVIRLADHLVLLQDGLVTAQGSVQELLTARELPFIRTETASTVLKAEVVHPHAEDELTELCIEHQPLFIARQRLSRGQKVSVRVMARDVALSLYPPEGTSFLNCLRVRLLDLQPGLMPSQLLVRLQLGQQLMLARISCRSAARLGLYSGQVLYALIKGVALS